MKEAKKTLGRLSLVGTTIVVASVVILKSPPSPAISPVVVVSQAPPTELSFADHSGRIARGYQHGMVSWANLDESLRINWYASVGPTDHTDLTNTDPAVEAQEQIIKLSNYVTDVTVVDEELIIIAEITNYSVGNGKLSIYEQYLDWSGPEPMAYFDSDGVERIPVKIPKLGKKRELFSETASSGRLGVRHLWNLRNGTLNNSTGLLVQFHDSGDVYSLDRTSLSMQLVVTPDTSITGVLHAPGIEQFSHYNGTYFQNSTGFVYAAGNPRQTHHLFMIDGDMDGVLDHAEYMTAANWAIHNGVNGSNWDHYGN